MKILTSIEKAKAAVLKSIKVEDAIKLPLEYASGLVLAEDIKSDIDIPSFNRAMMDGYAMNASDSGIGAELKIDATIAAGEHYDKTIKKGHAVKIMTGAPLPKGTDAVVQNELASELENDIVKIQIKTDIWKNVARKGEEFKKNDEVLRKGTVISAPAAAVLAMVGVHQVPVCPRPSVLILSTGSELIDINEKPSDGTIRESNSYGLLAQFERWGAAASRRPIVPDNIKSLLGAFSDALELNPEIIAISGGVSYGDYDYVREVLTELGIKIHLHGVAQKPGKPMLFGQINDTLVFGLPGNPTAVFMTTELYIGPAIRRMMGETNYDTTILEAEAASEFRVKSDRTWIPQSIVKYDDGRFMIYPVKSKGTADILSAVNTNAFAIFDSGDYIVKPGERVRFFLQRGETIGT